MSGGGNGADIAAVYQPLAQVARTVNEHTIKLRKLDSFEEAVNGLRETLTQYHSSVMGHGILITDLEHRVRRIEDHLHLPPVTWRVACQIAPSRVPAPPGTRHTASGSGTPPPS